MGVIIYIIHNKMQDPSINVDIENQTIIDSLPFTKNGYRFTQLIGKGGFSVVFKVIKESNDHIFAAKVIHLAHEKRSNGLNLASAEIESLKKLNHPNIIKLYDFFEEDDYKFLILQFCQNGTLKEKTPINQGLSTPVVISYFRQILEAINFMHSRNIAHRDIKPENILLDQFSRPLIADFGLNLQIQDNNNALRTFGGSPFYKAPEIIKKLQHDPFKADIWSLGVTLYYMAYGTIPWDTQRKSAINTAILECDYYIANSTNKEIADLIRSMLKTDPEKRPSANELLLNPIFSANIKKSNSSNIRSRVDLQTEHRIISKTSLKRNVSSNSISYSKALKSSLSSRSILTPRRMNRPASRSPINPQYKFDNF
ncbi:CAMK family protein kinase [Tritrichomonas foetus]|uniref:CAMK family protein kinase n=1 Tax=Tritrichomonas foetus TaxID=1144522 RepID=A0A1J4KHT2_9EUKA|nr:CAMK family protein kinase [Tritrichomonas foetus]|eukprot:OHT10488.1 CAMK family protein kinase [Tritrichomonas foetus]